MYFQVNTVIYELSIVQSAIIMATRAVIVTKIMNTPSGTKFIAWQDGLHCQLA